MISLTTKENHKRKAQYGGKVKGFLDIFIKRKILKGHKTNSLSFSLVDEQRLVISSFAFEIFPNSDCNKLYRPNIHIRDIHNEYMTG